jgi:hypothetical protein
LHSSLNFTLYMDEVAVIKKWLIMSAIHDVFLYEFTYGHCRIPFLRNKCRLMRSLCCVYVSPVQILIIWAIYIEFSLNILPLEATLTPYFIIACNTDGNMTDSWTYKVIMTPLSLGPWNNALLYVLKICRFCESIYFQMVKLLGGHAKYISVSFDTHN